MVFALSMNADNDKEGNDDDDDNSNDNFDLCYDTIKILQFYQMMKHWIVKVKS